MNNDEVSPPEQASEIRKLPSSGINSGLRAIAESSAVGLFIGVVDIFYAGREWNSSAYLVAGPLLGFRHGGRALVCWPILGSSLYVVHLVAIACGRQPPYVEENARFAEGCLWVVIPSGLALLGGVGLRAACSLKDSLSGKEGRRLRVLPKTTRELIVAVACIAVVFAILNRLFFPPTIYAPGFSEDRFRSIQVGMTSDQVLAALGPPLKIREDSNCDTWEYSDQYTYTSNYDRRWIFLEHGKVILRVNDYWID